MITLSDRGLSWQCSGDPALDLVSPGGGPDSGVEHRHHHWHGGEGQCAGHVHQGRSGLGISADHFIITTPRIPGTRDIQSQT